MNVPGVYHNFNEALKANEERLQSLAQRSQFRMGS